MTERLVNCLNCPLQVFVFFKLSQKRDFGSGPRRIQLLSHMYVFDISMI